MGPRESLIFARPSARMAEAAVPVEFFPSPHLIIVFPGQRETELVREQADLAAMMRFVREHVSEHGRAGGPWACPAVAAELRNAVFFGPGEGFGEHLRAEPRALGKRGTRLALR